MLRKHPRGNNATDKLERNKRRQQQHGAPRPSGSQLHSAFVRAKLIFRADVKCSEILADQCSSESVLLLLL